MEKLSHSTFRNCPFKSLCGEGEGEGINKFAGVGNTLHNPAKSCKSLRASKAILWESSGLLSKEQATREARLPFR